MSVGSAIADHRLKWGHQTPSVVRNSGPYGDHSIVTIFLQFASRSQTFTVNNINGPVRGFA